MDKRILTALFLVAALIVAFPQETLSKNVVHLVTAEREPYIGEHLPNKGYIYEVVSEAFRRVGYDAEISFYPVARATYLAENGWRDGVVPVYYEESLEDKFLFSDPFPGGTLGLLKRKSLQVPRVDLQHDQTQALRELQAYTFGVIRGSVNTPEFDNADFLKKDFATSDMQNLLKLSKGRIDFAVIDKYTAADIMVHQLPHLIGQLEFMQPPLATKPFHIAFSKNSPGYQQRLKDFSRGLQKVIEDHTLENILSKQGLLPAKEHTQAKTTTIRIGTVNNADMMIMQRLSREYERQHPDIELEWKVLHENILRLRLLSDLAISDGQFDIITIGMFETPIWAKQGWLLPIKNLPDAYDLKDVLKPVKDNLSYDDTLYALPFYAESAMTYYRKDLFEKAGITMPDRPGYDDIKKFAAMIHDPANGVYGIGLRGKAGWGENMAYISTLVNTFGGRWFDEHWNPTIDSPEWREALTFYKDVLTKYGHPNITTNGWQENQELFAHGHLGIIVDATSLAGRLFNPKYSKVYDKIGIVHIPIAKTPKGSHWFWAWALAIPSSSKVPHEALQFISWATSKEYIELVAESEGWISVPPGTRLSTYQNSNYQTEVPFSDFVLSAIQTADPSDNTLKPTPYTGIQYVGIPEFPAIGTQVGQKIVDVLTGEVTIDQALKELQRQVADQMQASGYTK